MTHMHYVISEKC